MNQNFSWHILANQNFFDSCLPFLIREIKKKKVQRVIKIHVILEVQRTNGKKTFRYTYVDFAQATCNVKYYGYIAVRTLCTIHDVVQKYPEYRCPTFKSKYASSKSR